MECSKCKKNKRTSYSCYCLKCKCEIQKKYLKRVGYKPNKTYKDKVRQLVIIAKSKPCLDCNKKYPTFVMDLDHVRGVKKFNLSQVTSHCWAIKTVIKEIDKCDAICSNCHRIRTFLRLGVIGST